MRQNVALFGSGLMHACLLKLYIHEFAFFIYNRFAAAKQNGDEYFILLIITDGIITDMPQTCEAIVNVSL